ncbi:hypothetical protein NDU88_006235 [Pleurodeles waltl]|uniref:Uncharacterized protein n=1 Tax=Pleurodeles waltl TaxID=8319 RepID=A0AAV7PHQ9_PLEWA|nr:hypothetical protein NDU88_006235 [Pleurodeles waltl]
MLYQTETGNFSSSVVSSRTWRTGVAGTKVCFFGFPEHVERMGVQAFLKKNLPTLTGISLDPPLEIQRAHCLDQKRAKYSRHPRPIITCVLHHIEARQLISTARSQGTFRANGYEIHIATDFSKETNEHRLAFLSLRPRPRQLHVKYGLLEPAQMWDTKNGQSQDFYDPEDLQLYLNDRMPTSMDMTPQTLPADVPQNSSDAMLLPISLDG